MRELLRVFDVGSVEETDFEEFYQKRFTQWQWNAAR
jgi:hypothetical protein